MLGHKQQIKQLQYRFSIPCKPVGEVWFQYLLNRSIILPHLDCSSNVIYVTIFYEKDNVSDLTRWWLAYTQNILLLCCKMYFTEQ